MARETLLPDGTAPRPSHQGDQELRDDERFEDLGQLGAGSSGEVRRVRDHRFDRVVAMKILHGRWRAHPAVVSRFVAEAQLTGQLQHPGIPAVYDVGVLGDGRHFFTMREIPGADLSAIVCRRPGRQAVRGLVEAFRQACEAVGYAHWRGVVHRDLKPGNVRLGPFGDVVVLDWGMARVDDRVADPVVTVRRDPLLATLAGFMGGTPGYMPPEQENGDLTAIGPWTDVWALGSVLAEILTGRPDPEPAELDEWPGLAAVVACAHRPDPADRYPDAGALAREVSAWLEGARSVEKAESLIAQARQKVDQMTKLLDRSAELRAASLCDDAAVERRRRQEAERLESGATTLAAIVQQLATSALAHAPDLPEAHGLLADTYRRALDAAERVGSAAATGYRILLKAHDRGTHAAWLEGTGRLSLSTDPPGAHVLIERFEPDRDGRLLPRAHGGMFVTPLREVPLPMGSWLLTITCPGRAVVRYPVHIGRGEHWDVSTCPLHLPPFEAIADQEVYVPAGPAWVGAVAHLPRTPARRVWVDGFAIRRTPVTWGEYEPFLAHLRRVGLASDAEWYAPSRTLDRNAPVVGIDFGAAEAFATWTAARTGLPWRLPWEVEREKAARGVDGRRFPWGSEIDPGSCRMAESGDPTRGPSAVGAFPDDVSVYGVRGVAGNVHDWCLDSWTPGGPRPAGWVGPGEVRVARGGAWDASEEECTCSWRTRVRAEDRRGDVGLRLVRPVGPTRGCPPDVRGRSSDAPGLDSARRR